MKKAPLSSNWVVLLAAAIATSAVTADTDALQNAEPALTPTLVLKWSYDTGG
jgi:hypothetical protein